MSQETVHVSLEPLTTEETSRIWALFPTANYRTSVAYLATPGLDRSAAAARSPDRLSTIGCSQAASRRRRSS